MIRLGVPALLAAVLSGCSESSAPAGAYITGAWAFGQRISASDGTVCRNHGTVTITQTGSSFTASYAQTGLCSGGPAGTVDNSGSGQISDGRVSGMSVHFSIPGCGYSGNLEDGSPPDGASGTVACRLAPAPGVAPYAFSGTWHVSHGVAVVMIAPSDQWVGTDATITLTATATDAAGQAITRPIVWRTSDSTVATVTPTGSVHTIAPGSVTITATTVPALPIEDSVTAVAGMLVMPRALMITAGWLHTCTVLADATTACWGAGFDGRLGNGTAQATVAHPMRVSGDSAFASVSGGFEHSCGTTATGAAYCWGKELSGELGDGIGMATRLAPVAVGGALAFRAVSAGNNFSCGVTTVGAGYCWGDGGNGRLGTGTFAAESIPKAVSGGLSFMMLSASKDVDMLPIGNGFACGITTSGAAYCWGRGGEGELGDSGTSDRNAPVPVYGGLTFATLSAGEQHVCGVTTAGAGYCWGQGSSGQLGNGSTSPSTIPVPVSGGLVFTTISAGAGHSCGVTTNGDAYCWGSNLIGQLGNGTFSPNFSPPQPTPTAVVGGRKFTTLAAGASHTCGIVTTGVIYCWGRGMDGELGNGTVDDRNVPTPVLVPWQ